MVGVVVVFFRNVIGYPLKSSKLSDQFCLSADIGRLCTHFNIFGLFIIWTYSAHSLQSVTMNIYLSMNNNCTILIVRALYRYLITWLYSTIMLIFLTTICRFIWAMKNACCVDTIEKKKELLLLMLLILFIWCEHQ